MNVRKEMGERCKAVRTKYIGAHSTYKLTERLAEIGLTVDPMSIQRYEKGSRMPGGDYLGALLKLAPQVNARWLATGEGLEILPEPHAAEYAFHEIAEIVQWTIARIAQPEPATPPALDRGRKALRSARLSGGTRKPEVEKDQTDKEAAGGHSA